MSERTLTFQKFIARMVPFVKERYAPWRVTDDATVGQVLTWYLDRGLMSFNVSPLQIHGICLIRLFDNLNDFLDPWIHKPTGEYCFIELIISSDPLTTTDLFNQLFERWGPQRIVLWDHAARTEKGAPRMYRWDQFEKIVQLMSKGLFEPIGK
jgi:hypothetical protein